MYKTFRLIPSLALASAGSFLFLLSCNDHMQETKNDNGQVEILSGNNLPESDNDQISSIIRVIHQDKKDNFWFGTNDDGVCLYDGKKLEYYSMQNGFAGFQVTEIAEDNKGYIWFATNKGVSRFDGSSFTNYYVSDGLSSEMVWSIFADSKDRIWAGTTEGLCRFDGTRFTPFEIPLNIKTGTEPIFSANLIWCVEESTDGNLWFATDGGGLCKYDGKRFYQITEKDGLCNNIVMDVFEDSRQNLWCCTMTSGVCAYDGKNFKSFDSSNGLGDNEVWYVVEDSSGNIWFPSEGYGVYKYDGTSLVNYSEKDGLNIKAVQSIFEDNKGNLWMGGGGGLYRFDGKTFANITKSTLAR